MKTATPKTQLRKAISGSLLNYVKFLRSVVFCAFIMIAGHAFVGCASFDTIKSEVGTVPDGSARIAFYGINGVSYGVLAGGNYHPEIVLDGKVRKFGHSSGFSSPVYFAIDVAPGKHSLTIHDGGYAGYKPELELDLSSNEIVWIQMEMKRSSYHSPLSLRSANYEQHFTVVDESVIKRMNEDVMGASRTSEKVN